MKKLYIITRRDLSAGAQCAQACHAALAYSLNYSTVTKWWHEDSNNIVVLTVEDESELEALLHKLREHKIAAGDDKAIPGCEYRLTLVSFREPDLRNQLTAVAVGDPPKELVSSLPLALRERIEHDADFYLLNGGKRAAAG